MNRVTYEQAQQVRLAAGAPWFTWPWDLNLVVVRSGVVGLWDDAVVVACRDDSDRPIVVEVQATGDASAEEFRQATHPDGAIWVLPQHVPGGLALGEYRGRVSLLQREPYRYVRWPSDGTVPTVDQLLERAKQHTFTAIRGTHIHPRSSAVAPVVPRAHDSAGCTVPLYRHEWASVVALVELQGLRRGSRIVSPTYTSWTALEGIT